MNGLSAAVAVRPASSSPPSGWAAFGLALILFGQPIGWWVRGTISEGDSAVYPAAVVLIGLAILAATGLQRPPRLHVEPALAAIPVCFAVIPIITLAATQGELMIVDLGYGIFMLILAPILWCIPTDRLERLPHHVVLVASISCGLALLTLAQNPVGAFVGRLTVAGNDNTILIGNLGATLFMATLIVIVSEPAGSGRRLLYGLLLAIGLACLMLSNTRSAMLGLLLAAPLAVWLAAPNAGSGHGLALRLPFVTLGLVAASVAAAAIVLIGADKLAVLFEDFINRFSGVFRGFGDATALSSPDQSTQERMLVLSEAWRQSGLLGNGVNAMASGSRGFETPGEYPHLTYLQVLLDLGTIPFFVYVCTMLVIPLWFVLKISSPGRMAPMPAFVMSFWTFKQADLFTHSTPYDWHNVYPTLLLFALLARDLKPAGLPVRAI